MKEDTRPLRDVQQTRQSSEREDVMMRNNNYQRSESILIRLRNQFLIGFNSRLDERQTATITSPMNLKRQVLIYTSNLPAVAHCHRHMSSALYPPRPIFLLPRSGWFSSILQAASICCGIRPCLPNEF